MLLGVYIVVSALVGLGDALVCLNCEAVLHPRLCKHVTTCFKGETCGMSYVSKDGDLMYKLGCVDRNTCGLESTLSTITHDGVYACNHCCDDQDMCNVRGCNSSGFPATRGPLCYNCEAYPDGYPCHSIEHCESNELCYNDVNLEFTSDTLHYSGCRSKHNCASSHIDPIAGFGKRTIEDGGNMERRSTKTCTSCCQGDLCNVQCQNSDICHDEPTCQQLMSNYDVCKTPDIAKQFCRKSCNLCLGVTAPCADTRVDCAYIRSQVNMCTTQQQAAAYGCLNYCGYCNGAPQTHPNTEATTTTATVPSSTTRESFQINTTTSDFGNTAASTAAPAAASSAAASAASTTAAPLQMFTTTADFGTSTAAPSASAVSITAASLQIFTTTTDLRNTAASTTALPAASAASTTDAPLQIFTTTADLGTPPTYGPALANALYIGARIQRGQDWKWETQDSNGPGTVIGFPPDATDGWVKVRWDSGVTNSYRMGADNAYDLMFVPGTYNPASVTVVANPFTVDIATTTSLPTYGPALAHVLYIGARVQRGKDWKWNDQDGNGPGTVIAFPPDTTKGWVRVRWDANGGADAYRMGADNSYDLMFVPGTFNPSSANSTATLRVPDIPRP